MGFLKPTMAILFLAMVAVSSAVDMSIISYDEKHGVSTTGGRSEAEVMSIYEAWLVKHGKAQSQNSLVEKDRRFEIFKDNLRFVDEHNEKNLSYRLGLTRFADLTNDEYRSKYLGAKMEKKGERRTSLRYEARVGDELPESIDWRKKGAVAEVKDQGGCGKFLLDLTIIFSYSYRSISFFDSIIKF